MLPLSGFLLLPYYQTLQALACTRPSSTSPRSPSVLDTSEGRHQEHKTILHLSQVLLSGEGRIRAVRHFSQQPLSGGGQHQGYHTLLHYNLKVFGPTFWLVTWSLFILCTTLHHYNGSLLPLYHDGIWQCLLSYPPVPAPTSGPHIHLHCGRIQQQPRMLLCLFCPPTPANAPALHNPGLHEC